MLRQPYMMSSDTIIFMKTQEQTRTLQDGTMLIIRSLVADDAIPTIGLMKRIYGESVFLARYPDEFTFTPEEEIAFIRRRLEDASSLFIGAFVDGMIVGLCDLSAAGSGYKTGHRASLSISIARQWQSKGIGSALLDTAIAQAMDMGYAQIELEVVSGNTKAKGLYRKYGFRRCGTIPDAFRLRDGSHLDLDIMVLTLPPEC